MRIVAGSAKGRVLAAPKSDDVIRPTADRVRETIFNVLGQRCDGLTVLDLFAGTGALGLEAVSRGASKAVLVDRDKEALALCRLNTDTLKFTDRVEILPATAIAGIAALGKKGRVFELVFSDPPYALTAGVAVLEALAEAKVVSEGGVAVIEHGREETLPERVGDFVRIDERDFGTAIVTIFRRSDAGSAER
jgi:16S rRNA (guanine(966)-N(2))-methyltransferase RsmD